MNCHSLRCVNSNSVRFETGHELIKESYLSVTELRRLNESKILSGPVLKSKLLQEVLATAGIHIRFLLMRYDAHKPEPSIGFVQNFHNLCDDKSTLMLVKGAEGEIFGACTDISWKTEVPGYKQSKSNSFIFFLRKGQQKSFLDAKFMIRKVKKHQSETYVSPDLGPNFVELIIRSPHDQMPSEVRCLSHRYNLKAGDITNSPVDSEYRQFFRWSMLEVYWHEKRKD